MIREMVNEFAGVEFYRSTFDTVTGTIVRIISEPTQDYGGIEYDIRREMSERENSPFHENGKFKWDLFDKEWKKKFHNSFRSKAWSPSPETIDVKITGWCDFGCPYCYMDSKKSDKNQMSAEHLEKIIKAFDPVPYQIAFGGGEPCSHPDFAEILKVTRKLGVVPNFTTAGHIWKDDVINAANEYCGGIALSYHAFKGIEWFRSTYKKWKNNFRGQINVHLVAGFGASAQLRELIHAGLHDLGPLNIVLLAYYPEVGRSKIDGLMDKDEYMTEFPLAIKEAIAAGMKISFSEGLIPYFISRPEIGLNTSMAGPQEGSFSCYINEKGWISRSSFDNPKFMEKRMPKEGEIDYKKVWNSFYNSGEPGGETCYDCRFRKRCSTPSVHHYLICKFAALNGGNPPMSDAAIEQQRWMEELYKAEGSETNEKGA